MQSIRLLMIKAHSQATSTSAVVVSSRIIVAGWVATTWQSHAQMHRMPSPYYIGLIECERCAAVVVVDKRELYTRMLYVIYLVATDNAAIERPDRTGLEWRQTENKTTSKINIECGMWIVGVIRWRTKVKCARFDSGHRVFIHKWRWHLLCVPRQSIIWTSNIVMIVFVSRLFASI